jgi:hypothetical protein
LDDEIWLCRLTFLVSGCLGNLFCMRCAFVLLVTFLVTFGNFLAPFYIRGKKGAEKLLFTIPNTIQRKKDTRNGCSEYREIFLLSQTELLSQKCAFKSLHVAFFTFSCLLALKRETASMKLQVHSHQHQRLGWYVGR